MHRLAVVFIAGFLLTAPVRGQAAADLAPLLRASLAVDSKLLGSEPATVRFTLENISREELSILTWHTPLEGIWADIFTVERNGRPVAYRGPLVKRGVPSPQEYVRLAPGRRVSAAVDLAKFYDLGEPGRYRVRLRARIFDLGPSFPYGIYLCNPYFTQLDKDKAGTLIHEMSHFTAVAGTGDKASGAAGCEFLANVDPDSAAINAESYQFFAENDPYLKLRPDERLAGGFPPPGTSTKSPSVVVFPDLTPRNAQGDDQDHREEDDVKKDQGQ